MYFFYGQFDLQETAIATGLQCLGLLACYGVGVVRGIPLPTYLPVGTPSIL